MKHVIYTGLSASTVFIVLSLFAGRIPAGIFFALFIGFLFKRTLSTSK